ncbi:MAG: F0F1 ATP synthase subunit delta [Pseudomonadota bacterium]
MIDSGKMTTIARPYAAASFEYAIAHQALPAWETFLQSAASITNDAAIKKLFASPNLQKQDLAELYCNLLQPQLDNEKKNFLRLLAENLRLEALPEIAKLFAEARAAAEKKITVTVTSAAPLDEKYQQTLIAALTKRLQREVELENEVDETLLGGVVVRAGDIVIDGSIRGKLLRLNEFI